MKIVIGIGHPAHVHFFKNFIWEMEKRGHEVIVLAREKEITCYLLKKYEIPYIHISTHKSTTLGKMIDYFTRWKKTFKLCKNIRPDIAIGVADFYIAQVGKILNIPTIIFDDSEPSPFEIGLYKSFATTILTPSCFKKNFGKKQIRYNGYHELAYLHPNYFEPDPSVLDELSLNKDDKFIILRFVAWQATHDIRQKGFDLETKRRLVKELERYGKVLITSEKASPKGLERNRTIVSPERIHELLYYATMLIGDTQTMTTEAACLGTPAIRSNSFVGENDMGNFIELEQKYGLIFNYREPKKAIEKAIEFIQQPNLKQEWQKKREKLLRDKIDVTAFMTWFIENYPESFQIIKQNPEYQERFK